MAKKKAANPKPKSKAPKSNVPDGIKQVTSEEFTNAPDATEVRKTIGKKEQPKIQSDDGTYDWIRATVTNDGIEMVYKTTELTNVGSDMLDDECAKDWDDKDVLEQVASMLSLKKDKANLELIQLERNVDPEDDDE